jgi:hypothetical protein
VGRRISGVTFGSRLCFVSVLARISACTVPGRAGECACSYAFLAGMPAMRSAFAFRPQLLRTVQYTCSPSFR